MKGLPLITNGLAVGLIGGECTGKSTLARAISEHKGAVIVPEFLREFVDTNGRPPNQAEQIGIMHQQMSAEDYARHQNLGPGMVVCDPAAMMTAAYSIAYFNDHTLIDEAVAHALDYGLIIWCGTDIPWEPDGDQRDGPAFRESVDLILADLVAKVLVPAGATVHRIDGPLEQRMAALRALDL